MNKNNLLKITSELKTFSNSDNIIDYKTIKRVLVKIKNKLIENKKKIVKSISLDINKPIHLSEVEFTSSMNIWSYVINNINLINRNKKYIFSKNKSGKIIYIPIGLVGFITPWNYPLLTLSERLPFCIGAGCTAIIKPSEFSPRFTKILIKLINNDSTLNKQIRILSNTKPKTGIALCNDTNIDLISFVGSTKTGKKISKQCSVSLKKTNLELGGKNAAIVCKSSKIDFAISQIINGIFENGGQACVAISRVLIDEKIYNIFINKIIFKVEQLIKSNKLKLQLPANNLQSKKIISVIKQIKSSLPKNALKIFNFKTHKNYSPIFIFSKNKKNFFLDEEFFFPIVSFGKFKNINECIKLNNSTSYGLASYIFSSNKDEKDQLINNLKCGRIWINSTLEWNPILPVGGFNMSGNGRDMGIDGFLLYLSSKSVYINN